LYLNYDKYFQKFEYDDNLGDIPEQNLNKNFISKEDQNDKILKNNLDFTKIYHEKNRMLLNKFTQEFQDEINVKIFLDIKFYIIKT
jgi:hypothetical protein